MYKSSLRCVKSVSLPSVIHCCQVSEVASTAKMLQAVFDYFDSDGDGFLNLDEFNRLQLGTGSDAVRHRV